MRSRAFEMRTIEGLRNLWTRTGGACAYAQFPVIGECPLINATDEENTRTRIFRRGDTRSGW